MKLELKYCERCGGLWLRLQGTTCVYCDTCRVRLEAMPHVDGTRRGRVRRRKPDLEINQDVRIDCLQGVSMMEVRL